MRLAIQAAILAACHLPEWNGTVPPVAPRSDACGSGARTSAGIASIHRSPYLLRAEETAVTIAWAGIPDDAPRVVLTREDDPKRVIATVPAAHPAPEPIANAQRAELYDDDDDEDDDIDEGDDELEAADYYELVARVGGLDRGVRYCYQLVSDRGRLTEPATLTLAPRPDAERVDRFVILGDSGTGRPAQIAIARRIARQPMDAIMFLGDLAYPSGTHDQLQARFFEVYAEIFKRIPVYVAIGNHDVRTDGGQPLEEALLLPAKDRWYSFGLGDVHFVILDTTRIGREQASWLDRDLARRARTFTVILAHHPPHTSGYHGASRGFRTWFVPVIERHRVELVLGGHDHHYERLHASGITYVVSGGGGARLRRVSSSSQTARIATTHHFLVLEAHADRLRLRAIDIEGKEIDRFEIERRR